MPIFQKISKALDKSPKFSIVIPCYNEKGNLSLLHKEITDVMNNMDSYEVIYVNDGSSDNTLGELNKLKDKNTIIIDLNRNYGQATALDAGFKHARGEYIISMDADMQNDPKDVPKLYSYLIDNNLDVVAGWRKNRKDKKGIRILTRIGRLLRRIMINDKVHDTGCTLRIYRSKAVKSLDIGGEMHRYILALLRWKGFRIGEVIVNHRKRKAGKTKYGYSKALKGFIDLIYIWFIQKYSQRPIHIFGAAGLLSFFLGTLIELAMVYQKIFNNIDLSANAWFILGFFLILGGIIFFSFGIAIDLLIKIHHNASPYESRYYVRSIQ